MTWPDPRLAPPVTEQDRAIARVVLGLALVGVGWMIWRTPPVRRLAVTGARFIVFNWLPALVLREVRRAWAEAGEATRVAPEGAVPPARSRR